MSKETTKKTPAAKPKPSASTVAVKKAAVAVAKAKASVMAKKTPVNKAAALFKPPADKPAAAKQPEKPKKTVAEKITPTERRKRLLGKIKEASTDANPPFDPPYQDAPKTNIPQSNSVATGTLYTAPTMRSVKPAPPKPVKTPARTGTTNLDDVMDRIALNRAPVFPPSFFR